MFLTQMKSPFGVYYRSPFGVRGGLPTKYFWVDSQESSNQYGEVETGEGTEENPWINMRSASMNATITNWAKKGYRVIITITGIINYMCCNYGGGSIIGYNRVYYNFSDDCIVKVPDISLLPIPTFEMFKEDGVIYNNLKITFEDISDVWGGGYGITLRLFRIGNAVFNNLKINMDYSYIFSLGKDYMKMSYYLFYQCGNLIFNNLECSMKFLFGDSSFNPQSYERIPQTQFLFCFIFEGGSYTFKNSIINIDIEENLVPYNDPYPHVKYTTCQGIFRDGWAYNNLTHNIYDTTIRMSVKSNSNMIVKTYSDYPYPSPPPSNIVAEAYSVGFNNDGGGGIFTINLVNSSITVLSSADGGEYSYNKMSCPIRGSINIVSENSIISNSEIVYNGLSYIGILTSNDYTCNSLREGCCNVTN